MNSRIENLLRQDRLIVVGSLVFVTTLCWGYLFIGAGMGMSGFEMTRHSLMNMDMMARPEWSAAYVTLMFFMWWVMMIAMMLPSATPVILLSAALNRRSASTSKPFGHTAAFASGYLLTWGLFSLLAVLLQWSLQSTGLINGMLRSNSPALSAALLITAGVWQFAPLKNSCLKHCRSPIHYLTHQKRKGTPGALIIGVRHGTYCLGCCWFLMVLLFVGGVMNLIWIAGLTIYVWVEKILPAGEIISRVMGGLLIAWGVGILVSSNLS